jgi:hypothetical protein
MPTKLSIGILTSELPFDPALLCVSSFLPGVDLGLQQLSTGDASIQTLPAEDADFDFRHVQPTRMLGRVVKMHSAQELCRRALAQHVLEGLPEVGVQVVQDQVDATRLGIRMCQESADEGDEVDLAACCAVTSTIRRPPLGSTATNRLVVPLRTYS